VGATVVSLSANVGDGLDAGAADVAGAAGSDEATGAAPSGATAAGATEARCASPMSALVCSRDSGPGRYDIAQRLVNNVGASVEADRNTNSRFARPLIVLPMASTSVLPAASRN